MNGIYENALTKHLIIFKMILENIYQRRCHYENME
jgi:hypothetical protein